MDVDWVARGLAAGSLIAAVGSFAWAIASWRLSGPGLRIHALAYRDVLLIRVFNAGRLPDTLEHLVVGGTRRLEGGRDLRHQLGELPLRLEPGRSAVLRVRTDHPHLVPVILDVRRGWASMWVLTGAMRQHRVEVLPRPEAEPPTDGWLLVARSLRYSRYLPFLGLVAAIVSAFASQAAGIGISISVLFVVAFRRMLIAPPWLFARLRAQRWATIAGPVLGIVVAGTLHSQHQQPLWLTALLVVFLGVCAFVSLPSVGAAVTNARRVLAHRLWGPRNRAIAARRSPRP